MKRCKICDKSIEDNVTICPYCKADQTNTRNGIADIYNYASDNSNFIGKNISEIAKDIRFIANVIKAFLIIDIVFALFYILGQLGACS